MPSYYEQYHAMQQALRDALDDTTVDPDLWAELDNIDPGERVHLEMAAEDLRQLRKHAHNEELDPPRVLVKVSGGVADVSATPDVLVCHVDYDDDEDATVPEEFQNLGDASCLEDFVSGNESNLPEYRIPVTWTVAADFVTRAATLDQAIQEAIDGPLPEDPYYVDDSFQVTYDCLQEMYPEESSG